MYKHCSRKESMCRYATTATVFQSEWSLNATINLGHKPLFPVIIGNAPDPSFYSRLGRPDPTLFWQVRCSLSCPQNSLMSLYKLIHSDGFFRTPSNTDIVLMYEIL